MPDKNLQGTAARGQGGGGKQTPKIWASWQECVPRSSPGFLGGSQVPRALKSSLQHKLSLPAPPAEVASSCSALLWPARVPEVPAVPCHRPVPRGTLT